MLMEQHELAWTEHARCADRPSQPFYAPRTAPLAERDSALECCNAGGGCPARRHCLAYAIDNTERDGIWGGMSARERNDLARTRCPRCRTLVGRPTVAAMVLEARQHRRCTVCGTWVEVVPSWETPHRNSWITGTGRRT